MIENSEISQVTNEQHQHTKHTPKSSKISPKQPEMDCIKHVTQKTSKISPKEMQQLTDLEAMEEGAVTRTPTQHTPRSVIVTETGNSKQQESPQEPLHKDNAQQYLNENFSDVMRTLAIGSNISSLFNTIAFTSTYNEQKITLKIVSWRP